MHPKTTVFTQLFSSATSASSGAHPGGQLHAGKGHPFVTTGFSELHGSLGAGWSAGLLRSELPSSAAEEPPSEARELTGVCSLHPAVRAIRIGAIFNFI